MSPSSGSPELSVAQVLQVFLPEYRHTHALPVPQLKVLERLRDCRSGELGWSLWSCADCPATHWRPNVCGDRHCPSCQYHRSAEWLEKQRAALLPVRYFHWVFTLPARLRPLVLQNQKALYNLLFDSASATLLQFGRERFGAEIGLTALLHTWGQNLMDHPHLHCLVTGGGLTPDNQWAGPQQARYLFAVHAVSDLFRGKFLAGLVKLHATGQLQFHGKLEGLAQLGKFTEFLRPVQTQRWNVFAKGSVVGSEAVLQYLGRYTHRVALSNSRLRGLDPEAGTVTFTLKDYADQDRIKSLSLDAQEFIRRLRLHILPSGFTKIRHYGLLGNNRRKVRLPLARAALEPSPWRFEGKAPEPSIPAPGGACCPRCQGTRLRCLGRLDRSGKLTLFASLASPASVPPLGDTS